MLFEARDGGAFRRPMIGAPNFIAGALENWPLEPIALSDGLPFLVVRGYALGGKAESPSQYVAYCLSHCRWSHRKYASATVGQIARALELLISANEALRAQADWLRRQAG
jgi:hypothetical protein